MDMDCTDPESSPGLSRTRVRVVEDEAEENFPLLAMDALRRARGGRGAGRGLSWGSDSPSLPTGVGGSAPGTACWLARAVPGRLPPYFWDCWSRPAERCWSFSGTGGGPSGLSKALATGGRDVLGLLVAFAPLPPVRRCSISRMRASSASSSVVCVLICCLLGRGQALVSGSGSRAAPGEGERSCARGSRRLTACLSARPGRPRCSRCERCPSARPRRTGRWCCCRGAGSAIVPSLSSIRDNSRVRGHPRLRTTAIGLPVAIEFLVCHVHGGGGAVVSRDGKASRELGAKTATVWGRESDKNEGVETGAECGLRVAGWRRVPSLSGGGNK